MRNELSVEIARPVGEVFEFTINNTVEWSEIVVEDEVVENRNNGGVGTTFRVVTQECGRRMQFDGVVTRHDPPTVSAMILRGPHFDIEAEYTFEDLSGRTRVTQMSSVRGKGLTRVMFFLLGWLVKCMGRKALQKDFATLKRLLESPGGAAKD